MAYSRKIRVSLARLGQDVRGKVGRNRGTNKKPKDMTVYPERPAYKPPAESVCEALNEIPIDLGDGHSLFIRQSVYHGLTVWFAIMQHFVESNSKFDVARIDCCHSEIHRHVFNRAGDDLVDAQTIAEIDPDKDPWKTVDEHYDPCFDRMQQEFLENHRRWANG